MKIVYKVSFKLQIVDKFRKNSNIIDNIKINAQFHNALTVTEQII